jgi:hypothetical protein
MLRNLRTPLIVLGGLILLAAASFTGLSQLNPDLAGFSALRLPGAATDASGKQQGVTFDVIRATEMPATNPDFVGRLDSRKDNSLMVRPDSKGAPAPLVEVVVTGQTRLYRNATGDQWRTPPPAGTTVQMVLVPYTIERLPPATASSPGASGAGTGWWRRW